jgi:predicted ATP-grasp superfamily ATP-dependent carboligase
MAPLKVLAFDYATAGGPMPRRLPQSLRRQGDMLLQALQADLRALPGVELTTMAPAQDAAQAQQAFSERFEASMEAADAVWPLASESEGLLERLSHEILRADRILLGSAPGAVRVAASKLQVAHALADGGVPVAATYSPHAALPDEHGAWVVKPDDGAGCFNIRLFSDRAAALAWIRAAAAEGYVLQPFIAGKLGSLSLLCCDGVARVLSCNLERVAMRNNRFPFPRQHRQRPGRSRWLARSPGPAGSGGDSQPVGLCRRRLRPHRRWRGGARRQSAAHRCLCRPACLDRPQPGRPRHRIAEGPAAMPGPLSVRRTVSVDLGDGAALIGPT